MGDPFDRLRLIEARVLEDGQDLEAGALIDQGVGPPHIGSTLGQATNLGDADTHARPPAGLKR